MTRVYYREAMGAFIVFDLTRPASFEAVTKWKEDLDSKLTLANGKHIATVLLANKCDQGNDVLTNNGIKMEQFCQENGFVGWYETSAKVSALGHPCTHKNNINDNQHMQTQVYTCIYLHIRVYIVICSFFFYRKTSTLMKQLIVW